MEKNAQTKVMMKTLRGWLEDQKTNEQTILPSRTCTFLQSPHEILGEDGKVVGLRIERNKLDTATAVSSAPAVRGLPGWAVYAIGY